MDSISENGGEPKKQTIKLTLEYDGTDFAGWQVQPNQRTVQEELEKALFELTGEKIRVTAAGRTDAGVHALGQVVSFRTGSSYPPETFKKALNGITPKDMLVHDAERVPDRFCARRWATERTYRYRLSWSERAIGRQYVWHPWGNYDLDKMRKASEFLKGEHDFTSFCKERPREENPISIVYDIQWIEKEDEIWFEITAVRFFHNMIRIILGTLLEVGAGKREPEDIRRLLKEKDRTLTGQTIPPHGLCFLRVKYDERKINAF